MSYPDEINDWDDFLFRNYNYGIYEFSYCLAKEIAKSDHRYEYPASELPPIFRDGRREEIEKSRKAVKDLQKLRIFVIDILSRVHGLLTDENPTREQLKEFVINQGRVRQFIAYIDEWMRDFKEKYEDRTWRRKGRAVETKYKIACIFAEVITKRTPDWGCLDELLWWFYDNLEGTVYYKDILQPNDEWLNKKKLKTEYYVIMDNNERRRSIERMRAIYFPSYGVSPYGGFSGGIRINFGKKYINFSACTGIGKKKTLIKFPNLVTFKDRLNLKEAAILLGMPVPRLREMIKKGYLPYWLPQEKTPITLSRRSLLEWKYQKDTGSMRADNKPG